MTEGLQSQAQVDESFRKIIEHGFPEHALAVAALRGVKPFGAELLHATALSPDDSNLMSLASMTSEGETTQGPEPEQPGMPAAVRDIFAPSFDSLA